MANWHNGELGESDELRVVKVQRRNLVTIINDYLAFSQAIIHVLCKNQLCLPEEKVEQWGMWAGLDACIRMMRKFNVASKDRRH